MSDTVSITLRHTGNDHEFIATGTHPAPTGAINVVTVDHTHDVNIAPFNSAAANPPFLALNFIIRT